MDDNKIEEMMRKLFEKINTLLEEKQVKLFQALII